MNFHLPHLRAQPPRAHARNAPPPRLSPVEPEAGGATPQTSTGATGRADDKAGRAPIPGLTSGTGPVSGHGALTARPADLPKRITPLDCQLWWCHHSTVEPTVNELRAASVAARERGDELRARLYARHIRVLVRRAQQESRP